LVRRTGEDMMVFPRRGTEKNVPDGRTLWAMGEKKFGKEEKRVPEGGVSTKVSRDFQKKDTIRDR